MAHGLLDTIFGVLIQLLVFLWIVGLGTSIIGKNHSQYLQWTQKTLKGLWNKEKKFIIGLLVGWLLSYPGSIHLLMQ